MAFRRIESRFFEADSWDRERSESRVRERVWSKVNKRFWKTTDWNGLLDFRRSLWIGSPMSSRVSS